MDKVETNTPVVAAPTVPMKRAWRTLRDYVLWSYERGTIQYDVMVTVILIFVFASPLAINFKDKPVEHNPHRTGVVVIPDGRGGFIYQIEARAIAAGDEETIQAEMLSVIEPISGEVSISHYEAVRDGAGSIVAYKVWVQR